MIPMMKREENKMKRGVELIALSLIRDKERDARDHYEKDAIIRLADSIRRFGVLQPLTVRRVESENGEANYEVISGSRRLRAAKLLGLSCLPCITVETDRRRADEMALVENLQCEGLTLFEQAEAISRLMREHGMTQEEVAILLSVGQSSVANKLRLLRFTPEEREAARGRLTERHLRALLRIHNVEKRKRLLLLAANEGLTVARTEEMVEKALSAGEESRKRKLLLPDLRPFFNSVERSLSLLRRAGYDAETEKKEEENGGILLSVRITGKKSDIAGSVSRETFPENAAVIPILPEND